MASSGSQQTSRQSYATIRSSHPEVFLGKCILKIWSKFTGEHPCRSVISVNLQSNFIEIALRYGRFPLNLLHIFRTPFLKNTTGWLLMNNSRQLKAVYSRWKALPCLCASTLQLHCKYSCFLNKTTSSYTIQCWKG